MNKPTIDEKFPELPFVQRRCCSSGSYPMVNDPEGDYVDYDDHVAAMHTYAREYAATLKAERDVLYFALDKAALASQGNGRRSAA